MGWVVWWSIGVCAFADSTVAHPSIYPPPPSPPKHTEGKPLTSPSTNLEITDPALAMLVPNVRARSQLITYRETKMREWEAVQRAWEAAVAAAAQEGR